MAELQPIRDFKFNKTWAYSKEQHEFEVTYLGGAIGIVWQRREGEWTFRRHNRTRYSAKRYKNRISAARALSGEPVADTPSRYAKSKRGRRRSLTADQLISLEGDSFWEALDECLV